MSGGGPLLSRAALKDIEGPVLLAVSGGRDSICMAELFYRTGIEFSIAHCNFHLRGEESDGDAAFVKEWADSHGARFFLADFDTVAYAQKEGISIEMAARDLRYSWFAELCRGHGFRATAVAHNANDNVETLILNLLRGTGGRGLRGMKRKGTIPGAGDVVLLRPLLDIRRKEIDGFMNSNGISYREDRTNTDTGYRRNAIRHEVVPVLERLNPSFIRTTAKGMEHFSQENDIAEDYFLSAAGTLGTGNPLDTGRLLGFKHWEYILFRYCEPLGMSAATLDELKEAVATGRNIAGKRFCGAKGEVIGSSSGLYISEYGDKADGCLYVEEEGCYSLDGVVFSLEIMDAGKDFPRKQPAGTVAMDADKIAFPLKMRHWEDGDWMRPLGMKGRKKLSDIFVDLKYPVPEKHGEIVIEYPGETDGRICAMLSGRIDDGVRISGGTRSVALFRIIN